MPLLPIDPLTTKGLNPAWESEVMDIATGSTVQCVFKHMSHLGKLPVEMACALTGAVLGNQIPKPCLVQVPRGLLAELPESAYVHQSAYLFGSTYVTEGGFLEQLAEASDSTIDNAVWNHFCSNESMAAKGAALDELLANWDRHTKNMRFDGKSWWLFDHDQALGPAHGKDATKVAANFKAHDNKIAVNLKQRRPSDHGMPNAARLAHNKQTTVAALAAKAFMWQHTNPDVTAIWRQTAQLIDLLSRRLPMLQSLIGERIHTPKASDLTWSNTPKPAPPPA